MKVIPIFLTEVIYRQLKLLIEEQDRILSNRKELLNGTKLIPAKLIVCSFLKDRYLFKYGFQKVFEGYGDYKEFKFELYQLAALSYFLDDAVDIPYHLDIFNKSTLKTIILKHEQATVKDEFQKYYEAELMEEYDMTFTELREEYPWTYDSLYKKYNLFNPES